MKNSLVKSMAMKNISKDKYKKYGLEKRLDRLINKSFNKTLLDTPVTNYKSQISLRGNIPKLKIIRKLPKPLQPTKATPKPIPKPRKNPPRPIPKPRVKSIRPVPLPRTIPKPIDEKVKKLIDEITPYYKPEAIESFNKILKDKKSLRAVITKKKKALRRAVKSFQVAIRERKDPAKQFYYTTPAVAEELRSIFNTDGAFKGNINVNVDFIKPSVDGEEPAEANANFNSEDFVILDPVDIIEFLGRAAENILSNIAKWISNGSGWLIKEVSGHFINIVKYLPLRGNSYIQLPKELQHHKKGLINLQNRDDKCFLWCHNRYLNPCKKNPQRITKDDRETAKALDYSGISLSCESQSDKSN